MAIEIVTIREEKRKYFLRVEFDANGALVLEGQDLSPGLEEMFGRDEYEYWYTVKAADVPALLASLDAKDMDPSAAGLPAIAELLRERFAEPHGIATSTEFKAWCKAHEIPFAFSSY